MGAVMNLSSAILEMTGHPSSSGSTRRERLREALEQFRLRTHIRKTKMPNALGRIIKRIPKAKPQSSTDSFSVRGFLQDKFSFKDLAKLPPKETREQFAPYLVPVTTTQVGRVSGY